MTTPSSPPPVQLGRYTLIRRLASGGMGEVYLAEAEGAANFKRRVAIKRILPHLARNAEFVDKFIDEANLMVQLHHGNIVPVQELQDHDGELYIVMEFLPGRDLKAVLRKLKGTGIPLPNDLALWVCTEILAGLDYAHRKVGPDGGSLGIVHRDVSPSNVMLGAGGEVKVCDFGIARARGGLHRSVSGTLQGKFVYMSPEQADGRPVDPRSDVFSTGLVLYELLTGVRPFEGDTETETLRLVRHAEIVAPSTLKPELAPLDDLIMKALTPKADDRYASAADMRRAILHNLADRRAEADAGALADFLRSIYPEGVVPSAEPEGPVSLDDALMAQLGLMTPSVDAMGRTRTATGPRGTPARRATDRVITGSVPGPLTGSSPGFGVSHPSTPSGIEQLPGKKRILGLGLVLGAVLAGGLAWWVAQPRSMATVQAKVMLGETELRDFELHVRSASTPRATPLRTPPDHQLKPGGYQLCVSGPRIVRECFGRTLKAGVNAPVLNVTERAFVRVDVAAPDGVKHSVTANSAAVGDRFEIDRVTVIRVHAEGYRPSPELHTLRPTPGEQPVAFTLVSNTPTPTADAGTPAPDAGVRPDAGKTRPVRPRVAPTLVKITSKPVAKASVGGKPRGTTPLTLREPGKVKLSAKGYVSQTLTVKTGQTKALAVELVPFGSITARAQPAASVIYIDGRSVSGSSISRYPIAPGEHVVSARFTHPTTGQKYATEQKVTVEPGKVAPTIQLKVPVPE